MLKFAQDLRRKLFYHFGVGPKQQFMLFFGLLKKLEGPLVGLESDQDSHFFSLLQRRIKLVEPADHEIPDKTIEEAGVRAEQSLETIKQCQKMLDESSLGKVAARQEGVALTRQRLAGMEEFMVVTNKIFQQFVGNAKSGLTRVVKVLLKAF